MPKSPAEILADPDFQALDLGERFKVMRAVDPNFATMDLKEQGKVLAKTRQKSLGVAGGGKPEDKGFFSTLGKDALDIASIPVNLMSWSVSEHPGRTATRFAQGVAGAQAEQFEAGRQARQQGNWFQGAGHTVAGALPFVGPMVQKGSEELFGGKPGEGSAHLLEVLGPEVLKNIPSRFMPRIPVRNLKNLNNPVEEKALRSVEGEVQMTPGQRAGDESLQVSERNLKNRPGTKADAERYYGTQEDQIAAAGRRRTAQQGGQVTNPLGAGSAVQETLTARVGRLKSYADKLYDSVRQTTARNVQRVQTGTKQVPGSNPLATGTPAGMPRTVPVFTDLETPVDLAPVRAQLKSVHAELERNLPEARRANSPAWRALDELMKSATTHMNAMDFDKFLSGLKALSRDGNSELLSSQSQRMARKVISAGEQQFQKAVAGAGPNVVDKLTRARKAVREYHETDTLLQDLNDEPAAVYKNLTTGGDRVRNTLGEIGNKAPKALRTIGRTYLEEMMDKATRDGGYGRSAGVKADWEKLGPETKKLLFGDKLTESMDDFLRAAKKLTPAQGSATADRLSALAAYGDVGSAILAFLEGSRLGHPGGGAMAGAGILYKTRVEPAMLARLTLKPLGANLLKQAITLPLNSPGFNRTMQTLNAMAHEDDQN